MPVSSHMRLPCSKFTWIDGHFVPLAKHSDPFNSTGKRKEKQRKKFYHVPDPVYIKPMFPYKGEKNRCDPGKNFFPWFCLASYA